MLPYWLFNTEGTYKPGIQSSQAAGVPDRQKRKRGVRNQLPSDRRYARSQLSQSTTPGDMSDSGESVQDVSTQDDQLHSQESHCGRQLRYWTKLEIEQRNKVPQPWYDMVNSPCHRERFLMDLGEDQLPLAERHVVPKDRCCSACNPALIPKLVDPPERPAPLCVPRVGTHARVAFDLFEAFAVEQANAMFGGSQSRVSMPAGAYMPQACRIAVANVLCRPLPVPSSAAPSVCDNEALNAMCVEVTALADWDLRATESGRLMGVLPGLKDAALKQFVERPQRRRRRTSESLNLLPEQTPVQSSTQARTERDNQVAIEAASVLSQSLTDESVILVASTPLPQPSAVAHPLGREHTPMLKATPTRQTTPVRRVLRERAPSSINRQSRRTQGRDTTPKPQLQVVPTSSRGRVRTLTAKGLENYRS
ncbi:hypothetical protein EK21DRAFT_117368 [Setomelanomma holmii]|uniref:Uncharacterized protein n=1 Tax=Setomelanomma holmii TaxID=210430 RepID=A0A9P4GZK5_9PLEO|nr:hypothetical protein EK21DRAFT_117368 [Setomelanomma holmii]